MATITYNGNGNTGGSAPEAQTGESVVVVGNTGGMTVADKSFAGWIDANNNYIAVGTTLTADTNLTAIWSEIPYPPLTGEPDLAERVYANLAYLIYRALTPEQKATLIGGAESLADELHNHEKVLAAGVADKLFHDIIINGKVVPFDGSALTITADPNPHNHTLGVSGNTVLNTDGSMLRNAQVRDIYIGASAPTSTTPTTTPKVGDIYIRTL